MESPTRPQPLAVGDQLPALTLPDQDGNPVRLRDLRGTRTVLFFYPKDDTPGCTTQACGMRDAHGTFTAEDVQIYGVSKDSAGSHQSFRDKHGLPFPLLVDEDRQLIEALGFWVEKSNNGKTYWSTQRSTVIVDEDGRIAKILRNVKPAEHVVDLERELGIGASRA